MIAGRDSEWTTRRAVLAGVSLVILGILIAMALGISGAQKAQARPGWCSVAVVGFGNGTGPHGMAQSWARQAAEPMVLPHDSLLATSVLRDQLRDCPGRIYAAGYSAGGWALGDAVQNLAREGADMSRLHVDLIGEPRRPGGGVLGSRGWAYGNAAAVRQVCQHKDPICNINGGANWGGYHTHHGVYPVQGIPWATYDHKLWS